MIWIELEMRYVPGNRYTLAGPDPPELLFARFSASWIPLVFVPLVSEPKSAPLVDVAPDETVKNGFPPAVRAFQLVVMSNAQAPPIQESCCDPSIRVR